MSSALLAFLVDLSAPLQICGEAEVWGDGIVPVPSAHLPGAVNVDLDGIYHSPLGATKVRCSALVLLIPSR